MKKGAIGVGSMMIFIAFLLAAAIASGTIMNIVFGIDIKVRMAGNEVRQEVGTMVQILDLNGCNGTDGYIDNFTMTIIHADDTLPINLDETLFSIELSDITKDYVVDTNFNYSEMENSTRFSIEYIQGPYSQPGFLNRDDVIKIFFWPPRDVRQGELMTIRIMPKLGQMTRHTFRLPESIVSDFATLYPTSI